MKTGNSNPGFYANSNHSSRSSSDTLISGSNSSKESLLKKHGSTESFSTLDQVSTFAGEKAGAQKTSAKKTLDGLRSSIRENTKEQFDKVQDLMMKVNGPMYKMAATVVDKNKSVVSRAAAAAGASAWAATIGVASAVTIVTPAGYGAMALGMGKGMMHHLKKQ